MVELESPDKRGQNLKFKKFGKEGAILLIYFLFLLYIKNVVVFY